MAFSIKSTYEKAFKLYKDTYVEMLPLVLLLVISEYFLKRYFHPIDKLTLKEYVMVIFLDGFINAFFLSIVLWGMNQRYHQQGVGYGKMIIEGSKHFLSIFSYLIIFFGPFVLTFVAVQLIYVKDAFSPVVLFLIGLLPLCYVIFIGVLFYVTPVLIVSKKYNVFEGIKKSWQLVRNYWLQTFQTVLILVVLMSLIQYALSLLIGEHGYTATSLITFSLWCAVMITHCEQLENNTPNIQSKGGLYGK